ncbi:uncharacterized protein LOC110231782 [Exaiptasia diaphana]|uniref:EGF-like domain-containing protein n=1 Tax=Exaiptasia diaphana TaxID=2652724 RepID=A0A913WQB5_EXADI|nr:uncharacterized protein LOC110231782 [Exaiptasia diaphana]
MQLNYFIITISVCIKSALSQSHCIGTCYSGRLFPEAQDIFHGKHIKGHSYNNITTDNPVKCYSSCVQDCRCKACQMKDARCELLDEDKTSKKLLDEQGYVHFELKQTMYHVASHLVTPGVCYNGCCRSQPCMNGATCVEHCNSPKQKFTCKCKIDYKGTVCEERVWASCMDVLASSEVFPNNGVYAIKIDNSAISVYCAFVKPNQAWTLIESFNSKANPFKNTTFYKNAPKNEDSPNFDLYRSSLKRMKEIRSKSTLFRATCDFPNRVSLTPDLLIGRLSDVDILKTVTAYSLICRRFKFIDVRGYNCSDCTALTAWDVRHHFHIDVTWPNYKCHFNPPIAVPNVDSFGFYKYTDKVSKCTAKTKATTQWWLGEEKQSAGAA